MRATGNPSHYLNTLRIGVYYSKLKGLAPLSIIERHQAAPQISTPNRREGKIKVEKARIYA